jgi:RecA/RadA recombinase
MAAEARDVLRYWLASVRLEESLRVRPRARRAKGGTSVPRLDHPAPGQEYFKLPRAELAQLLTEDGTVSRALDPELALFFEAWLLQQYRRGPDEGELAHVLCFPVVHLPRGELAGLLRRGVKLKFEAFRVPSRAERARNRYPEPPTRAVLGNAPRNEEAWPFFVDTRLLAYPLGVPSERIDALFDTLRERGKLGEAEMLALVASTLEHTARETGDEPVEGEPLARMLHAMQCLLRRSPARAEVYPLGIVVDGTQAKTTWHLQRELASLLDEDRELEGALGAYLTGRPAAANEAPQRALYPGPALTTHQRAAAESFWGSSLSAVCGPPGTGKTTLVLHLCAEALVRQVDALLDTQAMGAQLTLIASSNNRAVDNVIEPLSSHALPLALRMGSRQVCEHQLVTQLRGVAAWLARAQAEPSQSRQREYAAALAKYGEVRERVDARLAPRKRALARAEERAHVQAALAKLPATTSASLPQDVAAALDLPLRKLIKRLEALSELCGAKPTMAHANAVARHYEKTAKRELHTLETTLEALGRRLDVPLPPLKTPLDVAELMEAWEDGAETFLERLTPLRDEVTSSLEHEQTGRARVALQRRLSALGELGELPTLEPNDALARELFDAALAVREAWAKVHADTLRDTVEEAGKLASQEHTLRPLFRDSPEHAKRLCQLFGVWGSTLLSLGNCLPLDVDFVERVVIDEAGQCHPAHAVSALMRARQALILGDVHQLPPVIDLTVDDDARLIRGLRPKLDARALTPYRVHDASQVSAQALADRAVVERRTLVDHYRCQPEIIAVSDALCGYGLRVHAPHQDDASRASLLPAPLCMRDLRGSQERHAGSLANVLELRETVELVTMLLARGVHATDIAVITPYRGQLDMLRRELVAARVPLEPSLELEQELTPHARSGMALGTVHRFQGGERSIVLFSSVVTQPRSLGFLNERPNLLNVAISRAQQHFVCLGDRTTLRQGALTRALVERACELI